MNIAVLLLGITGSLTVQAVYPAGLSCKSAGGRCLKYSKTCRKGQFVPEFACPRSKLCCIKKPNCYLHGGRCLAAKKPCLGGRRVSLRCGRGSKCCYPLAKGSKNVLFVMVDDLRPQLSCYQDGTSGGPRMHTPNIDLLAARSLLLKQAHVQQALCSPSRTSLLTGRRPDTTHVHDLFTNWRKAAGNFTTIPQYFKENGYWTVGMGKIFHGGRSGIRDDPISWSERFYRPSNSKHYFVRKNSWKAVSWEDMWVRPLPDQQLTRRAKHVLQRLAPKARSGKRPFFMGVGFHKPHLPFVFPEEFLKLYPWEDIALPSNPHPPRGMPDLAWSKWRELRSYKDIEKLHLDGGPNSTIPDVMVKGLRRAYYATVTYIDSLVGELLTELFLLGLEENTIIVLIGDHGWQLGEHGLWAKHTNFELSTRAPMLISIPGLTDHGRISEELVEFVDLFPTLVEATGLPTLPLCPRNSQHMKVCREGVSMMPLVNSNNRRVNWKRRVFSQYPRRNSARERVMGYSMRTKRYRYTEWVYYLGKPLYMPDWSRTFAEELYDHKKDPDENINVAFKGAYKYIRRKLRRHLRFGWRAVLP